MLEGLRAVQNTWLGKAILAVIMGLIVVSFVVWGIGDIFRGAGRNDVARVGDTGISVAAFRQAYQIELQTLQQRARRPITNEEARQFGIDGQVLSRMISDAVLDNRIDGLGLAFSDAQMARAITSDPAFAAPGGAFDRARFVTTLRDQGQTEQSFVRDQRRVYLRQQFVEGLIGDLAVPQSGVEALHRFQAEKRSIDYVTLTAANAGDIAAPDDADLQKYFDDHKRLFEAPEYRKLVVLSLTPSAMSKPEAVSDADARSLYDAVKDERYGTPERRRLQQIVFPSDAEAAEAAARIKAGASFADIVKERKLDAKDTDLGSLTQAQIFDKAVADAAFSLPMNGTSDPIKSGFGPMLIHVSTIDQAALKPFAEVQPALKQELGLKASAAAIRTLHDKIEDARSSGKPLSEAVKAVGLDTRTIDAVDARGVDKAGKPVEGLADRDALLRAAFASDVGVDNDTVQGRDGSMSWFEVVAVEAARPKPLSEVKPEVDAAWRKQETAKRLEAKAADLVKTLDAGSVEAAAASLGGLAVEHAADIKRAGAMGWPAATIGRIFDVPVGGAGSVARGETERLLFKVRTSTVPPLDATSPDLKQLGDRYRTALSEDVLGTYLSMVGAEIGAKVNQEVVRTAVGAAF